MDMPISRASAYLRRNRSSHPWYQDYSSSNDVMSRSCPTPRTLEEHMTQARAFRSSAAAPLSVSVSGYHHHQQQRGSSASDSAPVVVRAKSLRQNHQPFPQTFSASSSPGPMSSLQVPKGPHGGGGGGFLDDRPSSAYSYDGGFFVTANNPNKDFFVIHPEWVSEQETVRKLSQNRKERNAHVNQNQAPPTVITWKSYKRSKSAPPPKYRNPITWID